jgi:large subunit ribosomal protein L24
VLIKSGDTVEVRTGNARGTRAKVLVVLPQKGKIVVEGVNRVYRHMRRSQKNPQGGRLSKEMPIDASNVQLVCPSCGQPTRIGKRLAEDGGKVRFCRKCGAEAGVLRARRAAESGAGKK